MEILNEITMPIGTLDELIQIGADPRKVASCHERKKGSDIKGCPWFRICRFRPWKEQQGGLKGPLNVGVEITLSQIDGRHTGQMEMACYQYYGNNTRARQKQQEETGELIRIVAYEGDRKQIAETITVRPEGEPVSSPKMERKIVMHEVSRHKRPAERFPVVAAAHQATTEMMDDVERQALNNALRAAGVDAPMPHTDTENDAPMPVGKPAKVKA